MRRRMYARKKGDEIYDRSYTPPQTPIPHRKTPDPGEEVNLHLEQHKSAGAKPTPEHTPPPNQFGVPESL